MKISEILIYVNLIGLIGLSVFLTLKKDTVGIVNMPELYNQYQGRKDVEARFAGKINRLVYLTDSLEKDMNKLSITEKQINGEKINLFNDEKMRNELEMQQQVWNQLNEYMLEFGKSRKYKLILGASNNGNIVYSHESVDLTKELIEYVNEKYEGK